MQFFLLSSLIEESLQNGDECSGNNLEGNGQVVGAVQR